MTHAWHHHRCVVPDCPQVLICAEPDCPVTEWECPVCTWHARDRYITALEAESTNDTQEPTHHEHQ